MKVTPSSLTPADYNPREFDEESLEALNVSMNEFGDISGITWNATTGNIVTGHHRWDLLCQQHGIDSLKFKRFKNTDIYLIQDDEGEDTGFTLRTVEWDIKKEKAANITANSQAVEGKFNANLQGILGDIKTKLKGGLFENLRLNTLEINTKPVTVTEETDNQKSTTMISNGGEAYKLVKLELSPKLAKRLDRQLSRFKKKFKGVEKPLDVLLTYLEGIEDKTLLAAYKPPAKKKARRRK